MSSSSFPPKFSEIRTGRGGGKTVRLSRLTSSLSGQPRSLSGRVIQRESGEQLPGRSTWDCLSDSGPGSSSRGYNSPFKPWTLEEE